MSSPTWWARGDRAMVPGRRDVRSVLRGLIGFTGKRLLLMGLVGVFSQLGLGSPWALSEEPEAFLYDSRGRRDPFVPIVRDGRIVGAHKSRATEPLRPVLYGILWDPDGKSIALINDLEVNVGDAVGGYRVAEIRSDAVVLARTNGERIVLELAFEAAEAPRVSTR